MKGLMRSFLLGVALPTLVGAVYFGLLASDVFVSETRFAIRTSDDSAASGLLATMLGPQGSGASGDDSYIVRDYILSRDMLRLLEASQVPPKHMDEFTDVKVFNLFNTNNLLVETERQMMDSSDEVWVVTDSSKFGRSSLSPLCPLNRVSRLITDDGITQEWQSRLDNGGVEVSIPSAVSS